MKYRIYHLTIYFILFIAIAPSCVITEPDNDYYAKKEGHTNIASKHNNKSNHNVNWHNNPDLQCISLDIDSIAITDSNRSVSYLELEYSVQANLVDFLHSTLCRNRTQDRHYGHTIQIDVQDAQVQLSDKITKKRLNIPKQHSHNGADIAVTYKIQLLLHSKNDNQENVTKEYHISIASHGEIPQNAPQQQWRKQIDEVISNALLSTQKQITQSLTLYIAKGDNDAITEA